MSFFSSFYSLGYSAINIVMLWLFIVAVGVHVLKLHRRHFALKVAYMAVLLVPLVLTVNYLADQNKQLNDAIRAEGGLKRTETR